MTRLKKNESITHIMSKSPIAVDLTHKISEIASIFSKNPIHHLPVVSGKKLIGIISFNDLLKLSFQFSFEDQDARSVMELLDHTKGIEDLMTPAPVCLSDKNTIHDAVEKLSTGNFHSLPIVDEEHQLVGIVTSSDLIRYLDSLY